MSSICRKSIHLFIGMFVLSLLISCSDDPSVDPGGNDPIEEPDETECMNSSEDGYQTIVQDTTREYVLYVPPSYDCKTAMPLVINFHGFGDDANDFANTIGDFYGMDAIADANNFMVAYPQGLEREKDAPEWDPGNPGVEDIRVNDQYFTKQLIADISMEFNVDENRIYAIGYSNGGMMAYGLACSSGDIIAAAGIMSGVMLDESCASPESTSIIHFHGIEDEVLPYDGNMYYQSTNEIIEFWVNHNNIDPASLSSTDLNNGDVNRAVYSGGDGNTSVALYTINNEFDKPGGHVWFSDDIDGVHPNQILWDFLSEYSLED